MNASYPETPRPVTGAEDLTIERQDNDLLGYWCAAHRDPVRVPDTLIIHHLRIHGVLEEHIGAFLTRAAYTSGRAYAIGDAVTAWDDR